MQGAVHNIALLMVTEGLLSREALERAVARKKREGGSLALNLVLAGAIDEASLARFYSKRLHVEPAPEAMLAGVDRETFGLVPLEIVYESAILPLYRQGDQTLVVGLVDPTDRGLLAEASFFSGYTLLPRMITVSQMARHFARLSGQPWRISVAEAERLQSQALAAAEASELGVDSLLDQTVGLDQAMEASLEASLDEAYDAAPPTEIMRSPWAAEPGPEVGGAAAPPPRPSRASEPTVVLQAEEPTPSGMSIWMGGRAAGEISQIRLKAIGPAGDESGPLQVDQAQLERAVVSTAQLPALKLDAPPQDEPLARVDVDPVTVAEVGFAAGAAAMAEASGHAVEGEAVTRTGPVKVLGFSFESGPHEAVGEAEGPPAPVVSEADHGFGQRPKTKVPAKPAEGPPDVSVKAHVHLLTRLGDVLGEANPSVAASLGQVSAQLEIVRHRDALGEAVVNGLSDWYDQVAVMTLNGPRAVLWRCSRAGVANEALIGKSVDIVEGGVLHRATQERVFYYGPLPASSRLRDGLAIAHDEAVLVAPIDMRGKTILLLALDPGAEEAFRSPGRELERLLVDLAKGLERVILLRKRGRRK